ncbi:MAG: hypothetical protein AAGE43_19290 [Pseudomonadota bacterium]
MAGKRNLITGLAALLLLATTLSGCATVGCDIDPLKPKKLLTCEMPLG